MATQQHDPAVDRGGRYRWQDWASLVLGIVLFISPWALGVAFADDAGSTRAAWDAWVLGIAISLVSLAALGRMEFRQDWVNLVLGIWVFIAPWVLVFADHRRGGGIHWLIGALVALIAAYNLVAARRALPGASSAYAGSKPPPKL